MILKVEFECCTLSWCSKCCGISDEALGILTTFIGIVSHVISKAINASQSESLGTTENPQLSTDQQIEALQSQITGLMAKVNDHINDHFQQLEEKLTTSPVPVDNSTSIPIKSFQITETMATHVIDEYRDR